MSKRQRLSAVPVALAEGGIMYVQAKDEETIQVGPLVHHTEKDLREAFGAAVLNVTIDGACAEVRFTNNKAAKRAVRPGQSLSLGRTGSALLRGVARYAADCQRHPQANTLKREVNEFMADFDVRQEAAKDEAKKQVVDDDGFTLVTKARGRKGITDGNVKVRATGRMKRGRDTTASEAFYGLDRLKARKKQLAELRTKFQEDKARIKKKQHADRRF
jgi:hypothetical protein